MWRPWATDEPVTPHTRTTALSLQNKQRLSSRWPRREQRARILLGCGVGHRPRQPEAKLRGMSLSEEEQAYRVRGGAACERGL